MADLPQNYAFADFPHVVLPAKINRRQFFNDLLNEMRAMRANNEVHPVYRLADLGIMPEIQIAQIVPILLPGSQIVSRDGFLWGCASEGCEAVTLFPEGTPAVRALHLFDGAHTIVNVSSVLALENSWNKNYALAYTRGVFLWLVMAKLVVPQEKRV